MTLKFSKTHDTDHCYCVILNADGGAAFPSEKTAQDYSSSDISSMKINTGSGKTEKTKDLSLIKWFEMQIKVKRYKGYTFIQYTSQDDALLALESMDHKVELWMAIKSEPNGNPPCPAIIRVDFPKFPPND
ncbi:hypothetical protein LOK49_LG13G01818 [Camellia lanceoleosa]|uniref:Uncharacterized protein n=1 Tax=Camellia lanceoleosa TaxID=1840588 RepID=A0ACC0FEJ6_9ERIC|nr:hypothetical protein LOK49_LG13G01818 [Camellia lanceoleosa]